MARLEELTREKVLAAYVDVRNMLAREAGRNDEELGLQTTDIVAELILNTLVSKGMSESDNTKELARSLVTLALIGNPAQRTTVAMMARERHCQLVHERALQDGRVGADTIMSIAAA